MREREFMKAEDAAAMLNVGVERVYDLVRTGTIPQGVAIRLGRQVRIDPDALESWIAAGGCGVRCTAVPQ